MEQFRSRIDTLDKSGNPIFPKYKKEIKDLYSQLEKANNDNRFSDAAELAKKLATTLSSIEAYEKSVAAQTKQINTVQKTGLFDTKWLGVGELKTKKKTQSLKPKKEKKIERYHDDLLAMGIPPKPYSDHLAYKAREIKRWYKSAQAATRDPSSTTPFEANIIKSWGKNPFTSGLSRLHRLLVSNKNIAQYDLEGKLTKTPRILRFAFDGVKNMGLGLATVVILPFTLFKHYKKILEGGDEKK
jgi:hypothetical protein